MPELRLFAVRTTDYDESEEESIMVLAADQLRQRITVDPRVMVVEPFHEADLRAKSPPVTDSSPHVLFLSREIERKTHRVDLAL
jgi:hypothetical protein